MRVREGGDRGSEVVRIKLKRYIYIYIYIYDT